MRDGVAGELHDLPAHVDDIAALGCAAGGLDVDAHDHARDRRVHIGDVQVLERGAGLSGDLGVGAVLHRGDGVDEV